jgi:hypothetical protein
VKKNQTLLELLAGIIGLALIVQIIHLIIGKDWIYNSVGLWAGALIACFWAIHLSRSLEDSLELGEVAAKKRAISGYITRMVVSLIVLGVVIYFKLGNFVDIIVGVFLLKISAYIQPITHKLFLKLEKKEGGLSRGE